MIASLSTLIPTLALLAAMAHEFAERETREAAGDYDFHLFWFIPGYGVAVALHTAFNQFPDRPMLAMLGAVLVAPILLIAILNFGTSEAQRWLAAECADHRTQVEALRAGRWPDGPAGQKIAALAKRLDAEAAKRVRRYWELQAWLVAKAEETLIEESAGDAEFDAAQVRAALAELEGLRNALGRSTFAALKALLPFSRNDYWEVAELRQRLNRSARRPARDAVCAPHPPRGVRTARGCTARRFRRCAAWCDGGGGVEALSRGFRSAWSSLGSRFHDKPHSDRKFREHRRQQSIAPARNDKEFSSSQAIERGIDNLLRGHPEPRTS